jgi:4-amino-4-deoxy-L-arabinose transferase-like glycosyltransferase
VILIIVVSLVGRAAFLVLFPHTLSLRTSGYDAYAVNVMEGRGFTRFTDRQGDSDLPPLYPFFLVGVYTVLGRGAIQVAVVQAILDGLTILLLFLVGRRVAGERVGLLSAGFYGLDPYLLYQNLTVNDTALFILLLTAGVWLSYRVYDTRDWRFAVALGVAFGMAALTKALVLLVWLILIGTWLRHLDRRTVARLALASGLPLVIVIGPWVIRNSVLDRQLVFISTNGGSNLYQGNNPCVVDYLSHGWDAQWADCLAAPPAGLGDAALDRWYRQQALDYLWQNPGQWARLLWTKFRVLWSPAITPASVPPGATSASDPVHLYDTPPFQIARVVQLLYFGPLLALAALGVFLAIRAGRPIGPLLAVCLAVTVVYLIFHPSTRYRSPADPFVFILSAIALERLWSWARRRRPLGLA